MATSCAHSVMTVISAQLAEAGSLQYCIPCYPPIFVPMHLSYVAPLLPLSNKIARCSYLYSPMLSLSPTEQTECQAFSPVVRIGTPNPFTRMGVCPPPFGSEGTPLACGRGGGGVQFGRWDIHFVLYVLCALPIRNGAIFQCWLGLSSTTNLRLVL